MAQGGGSGQALPAPVAGEFGVADGVVQRRRGTAAKALPPEEDAEDRQPLQSAVTHHQRLAVCFAVALSGLLLTGRYTGLEESTDSQPSRITHEAWPAQAAGAQPGAGSGWSTAVAPAPALRGCCGAPTEFVWLFLDEAEEARAGKTFRTRVLARDAQGRQARPADCKTLTVNLGLSGGARLSSATSQLSWSRSELMLDIENDRAEVVEAEVRIESPNPSADVLLHTSQIRFASGPAHTFMLSLRAAAGLGAATTAGANLQGGVVAWPLHRRLEATLFVEDRFGNRVPLADAAPGGVLQRVRLRTNLQASALEIRPEDGILNVRDNGQVDHIMLTGLKSGMAHLWLEPVGLDTSNSSMKQLAQDLKRGTFRKINFTVGFDAPPVNESQPPPQRPVSALSAADAKWATQAQEVREAALHAWRGYRDFAWGRDEVQPLSRSGKDTFGGIGMTVIDSLTTLWLMGFTAEFDKAAKFVADELDFDKADMQVSVFELVIRGVGGLLGAYTLSGKQVFLNRAAELADRLLPAFSSSTGLPWPKWNIARGVGQDPTGEPTILSEAGSVQLEFRALSRLIGDGKYQEVGDAAFEAIQSAGMTGLLPVYLTPPNKGPVKALASKFAFGALADSYYEYILKQWLQNPAETRFKDLWIAAMDELPGLVRPRPSASLARGEAPSYKVVEVSPGGEFIWKMDHLSCFAPAMISLGARELPDGDLLSKGRNRTWWSMAEGLTSACMQMWTTTRTGLAPEFIMVKNQPPHAFTEVPKQGRHSFLRPETAESLFYLYRATGDEKYRHWGQQMFAAITKHAKVEHGFCSVEDVFRIPTQKIDEMQSFVLAETFKYLYLLFSPNDRLDLDKYVLNTEGHPLPRPPRQK